MRSRMHPKRGMRPDASSMIVRILNVDPDAAAIGPMQKLCLLAADDEAFLRAQIADGATAQHTGRLDEKTRTLVRLAVLAAIDGPEAAYRHVVGDALRAGATIEETVDVLFAIAPTVGTMRVVAASARLAAALGFDLDPALER